MAIYTYKNGTFSTGLDHTGRVAVIHANKLYLTAIQVEASSTGCLVRHTKLCNDKGLSLMGQAELVTRMLQACEKEQDEIDEEETPYIRPLYKWLGY